MNIAIRRRRLAVDPIALLEACASDDTLVTIARHFGVSDSYLRERLDELEKLPRATTCPHCRELAQRLEDARAAYYLIEEAMLQFLHVDERPPIRPAIGRRLKGRA